MLYLTEQAVQPHLSMTDAISAVERAFIDRAMGLAVDRPRQRIRVPGGSLNVMQGVSTALGLLGYKAYSVLPHGQTSLINLIGWESGRLEAILESIWIGQMRTGAATAVAVKHLSAPNSKVMGMFGSGGQAATQLEAVCAVRQISEVKVYSRNREKLTMFCERMKTRVRALVRPAASPEDALQGSQIVLAITRGGGPVFDGRLLEPGTFVAAAGVNAIDRSEIDLETISRASVIVDSRETARLESGDLLPAHEAGLVHWEALTEIGDIAAGKVAPPHRGDGIVLFESHGMALQDIYCAAHIVRTARSSGTSFTKRHSQTGTEEEL